MYGGAKSAESKEIAMIRFATKSTVLMGTLTLACLTGCCTPPEDVEALKHQNEVLMQQNKDYRDQIAELEKYNADLKTDNDLKDKTLAAKNEEIAKLKAGQGAVAGTADGWQKGTFGDKIAVGSDVLFSPGRATLTRAGQQALSPIAGALAGQYAGLPVRVYGYTDADPIRKSRKLWKDNLDLSANRAMAVTRYLISRGVPRDSIETIAMGDTHFVASNKGKASKAKNRRVEIFVVKAR
jgi:flagellar motor protein MotB